MTPTPRHTKNTSRVDKGVGRRSTGSTASVGCDVQGLTKALTNEEMTQRRVRIVDREHPHFPESGKLTGKIITLFGTPMAELKLDNCIHGTDGCFVKHGQISIDKRAER